MLRTMERKKRSSTGWVEGAVTSEKGVSARGTTGLRLEEVLGEATARAALELDIRVRLTTGD
jgi:hypothetical protein